MAVLLRPAAIAGGRQVWPVAEELGDAGGASQRLVEAVARGDTREAGELLASGRADVNYAGVVWLDARRVAEAALREGAAAELRASREEIRADVSPLFLAAGNGDVALVRALLGKGADVNGKVFRGYPTTAAAREGHAEVAELLVRAGASQPACEEAIVEAALQGQAALAAIFMRSDLVRPRIAVQALVSAATRGFVDVVETLVKCGADPNATSRVLLRSLKPSLHLNVDCTALFAAIVSRQVAVVRQLLQAGVKRDTRARLGAWSWDLATGEELRVGAGLAEPYDAAWCAVEYYESTGSILRMLLQNGYSLGATHLGRTLLHHAVLCGSVGAVETLLACGADCEAPVKTSRSTRLRPVHMAARLGQPEILQTFMDKGCDVNARAEGGDVAAILAARHRHEDCLRVLVSAGADVALLNSVGESAASVASSGGWKAGFERAVLGAIWSGTIPVSSDRSVFSPMMFVARCGDAAAVEVLLAQPGVDMDEQDTDGCSPIMAAAKEGNVDAFRALVFAGANVKLCNKRGETAIGLAQQSKKRDLFEQVMLEFAMEKGMPAGGFYALHCASRRGDAAAVRHLASTGYDVNVPDGDSYTPLMLAAREGHAAVCELLISHGARCDIVTPHGETALSLARSALATASFNKAEDVIMDELGRQLVLQGAHVVKHTKGGRGKPHGKSLRMVAAAGVLRWGGSSRRNVVCAGMASTLAPPRWHHPPPPPSTGGSPGRLLHLSRSAVPARRIQLRRASTVSPRAFFGNADLDGLLRRAWRGANEGAERLAFEARQTAKRLDVQYSISRRVAEATRAARERAAEIDAELGVGRRWRSFSVDFSRNFPRYRRELSDLLSTPIGRALSTLLFVWLALSGWLFRIFIFSTFVLPFAAPLLLGSFANRVAIEGSCPACKRRFVGYRNQVIRCMNCQNIVWQPNSGSSGGAGRSRSSGPDVIDVEFEEK